MRQRKRIGILGSTGSIGCQTLEVVAAHPDVFELEVLVAQNNVTKLTEQAIMFKPNAVVVANDEHYLTLKSALESLPIKVFAGEAAIASIVGMDDVDFWVTALVGFAGLKPTLQAIAHGKDIALANKETLVVAGELVMQQALEKKVNIIPVDSEHSAIFQCLLGEWHNPIEKIVLTASGGPFRGKKSEQLRNVTKAQALKHPNWSMGVKVTIDSATLMNKGLEAIEAKWFFNVPPEKIEVAVHPQCIIHSFVAFSDGNMKAQLSLPDMRLPIQFALAYPQRLTSPFPRYRVTDYPQLTFEEPDRQTFRSLDLASAAMKKGGNLPCVLNAANEQAVAAFLEEKISFLAIPQIIENCMDKIPFQSAPTMENYMTTDEATRRYAKQIIQSWKE